VLSRVVKAPCIAAAAQQLARHRSRSDWPHTLIHQIVSAPSFPSCCATYLMPRYRTPAVTIVLIYTLPKPHCVSLSTADTQKKNSTKSLPLAGHYLPRGERLTFSFMSQTKRGS
jgi:hypothetical protein